jgi:metal-dependent amidase/aminoacylase/carboxypeptidase family protein
VDYLKEALETEEYVIALRRDFHRYPELSGKEEETVSRICEELEKAWYQVC